MSLGPSIKIFSDYLSKIYNIPHASTLTNSTIDAKDPGSHPPKSSAKPTEQVLNQQSRQGSLNDQMERQDASLKTSPAVLEAEDAKTSPKVLEQLKQTRRDSDEFYARSNDLKKSKRDQPVEAKMNQSEVYGRCDNLAVVKEIYPEEGIDPKENQHDGPRIEAKKHKFGGNIDSKECQPIRTNDKKSRQEGQIGTKISQPEKLRKDKESQSNDVKVGRADRERDVRHIPTIVEHVLQNKTDVLSPISSRSSLSDNKGTKPQGGTSRTKNDISLTALDELSCSLKIDEELLSSSYDQGLVRTFGRGDLDGPIAQSTLRCALEAVEEKTELWTTVVPQESNDDKTEMWSDNGCEVSTQQDTVTDKTEPWKAGTQDCTNEVKAALEKTEPWTDETMNSDGGKDGWLEQTTTKNVGEMQRILLQPQIFNSPNKVPSSFAIKPLVEDSVSDMHSVKDNLTLTDNISDISKSAKRMPSLSLRLNEPNVDLSENKSKIKELSTIDDQMNFSSQNDDGKKLEITKEKKSKAEKTEKSDFRRSSSKLEEIKCKSCQLVLSTREALKMHTCYSIMDKLIQSDGGTRRRNSSSGENKTRVTPSVNLTPRSDTKTKPKKKVNAIMAIKDDKLAKGEMLHPYVLSQERMEEMIENDRVDEEQTTLISPSLKKDSQVFNLNPPILHNIVDKPKSSGSRLFVIPSPVKITKESIKCTNVKLSSETPVPSVVKSTTETYKVSTDKLTTKKANSAAIQLAMESVNSSTPKLATENNEADGVYDSFKTTDLVQNIIKTKHSLKVNLPKQSLSQLKRKAESQRLTFKTRYYRTSVEIDEMGRANSEEKARIRDQDHSSQKRSDLPTSNGQRKHEDKEKQLDDKSVWQKKTGGDSEQHHTEKHLDEKSVVQKKTGGDSEHKVGEKSVNQKKVEGFNEHDRREKYPDEKSVKQKKTGGDSDSKKKRESLDKRDEMGKSNKKFKEEVNSKSEKDVLGKDDTVRSTNKAFGNVHQKRKMVSLDKKDSTTKVSTEVPKKTNIVNHFEAYNPHLHSENSPQRKRHKSDKTPSSHKERNDKKVKSEERHSTKNKRKSSPCESVSSPKKFKIPKYNGDKPPKKVKGFAPAKFLQNENIKTLAVGESGSSLLKSLLSDIKGDPTKAIEMFDKIDSKQNKMARNNRCEAKEAKEQSDISHEGWNQVKNAKDDTERKKLSEQEFGNPVPNHPNNNLSYHGYKRYKSKSPKDNHPVPASSIGFWDSSKNMPMYHLTNGAPTPLPGYTFRQKPNDDQLQLNCEENKEKLKLDDFVTLMKAVMYNKKAKKDGKGDDRKLMDEFETFLGHYKAGQEENTHFLEFYQKQGQVELEGWQVIQIMDLENQFSTFQGYYGLTDELSCVTCNKKHTFAL